MKENRKQTYEQYAAARAKKSPLWKDCICAFLLGGSICTLGELLHTLYLSLPIGGETVAAPLVSITLVFLSALLTGLGWYDNIAKIGGAGTLVPITGFANSVVSPALDNKAEGYVLGLGAKMFIIAGPVIVYGTVTSVIYGIIYWVLQMF